VADRGPGIAPEQQQLIFEKFRQIDGSVTRQHSGTGLGLAISRELTSLLGGEIGVTSAPGQGATFWVVLPVKIDASVQDVRHRMMLT
jgi:signal transduction histidine kinase